MPTRVNVHVKGLAVCFVKEKDSSSEKVWNVVFVCDDLHVLDFGFPGGSIGQLRAPGRDIYLDFDAPEIVKTVPTYDNSFDEFFNMSWSDVHGDDGNGKSNLRIRDDRPELKAAGKITTDLVWARIPHSSLSVEHRNDKNYWIQEIDPSNEQPAGCLIHKGKLAKEVVLSFQVKSQILWVRAGDDEAGDTKSFPVSSQELDFYLNNDCQGNCNNHNDFVDLYDFVIDDSQGYERRFLAGKSYAINTSNKSIAEIKAIEVEIRNAQGNCDPSSIEPPPGP